MNWTTDKPTKPGYYWYWGPVLTNDFKLTDHNQWPVTIAYVSQKSLSGYPWHVKFMFSTVRLFFSGCLIRWGIIPDDAKWIGPIEEPE